MTRTTALLIGFFCGLALMLAVTILRRIRNRKSTSAKISTHSSIQELRTIGELSVFKVLTKEIVTEIDHSWGDIGKKYLSWILSGKKMAMIFMFEIDFRYDLRSPEFQIVEVEDGFILRMPPCLRETCIRDIHFYDEQKSKLIPWLLPDLINTVFGSGFTEEDRNRLKDAALNAAQVQSEGFIASLNSEIEQSARQTLSSLAYAFGAKHVRFEFPHPTQQVVSEKESK